MRTLTKTLDKITQKNVASGGNLFIYLHIFQVFNLQKTSSSLSSSPTHIRHIREPTKTMTGS